jgi:hypothetical protein
MSTTTTIPDCVSRQFQTIRGELCLSGPGALVMTVFAETEAASKALGRLQAARPLPVDLWRTWGHEGQVERLMAAAEEYFKALGAQRFVDAFMPDLSQ